MRAQAVDAGSKGGWKAHVGWTRFPMSLCVVCEGSLEAAFEEASEGLLSMQY